MIFEYEVKADIWKSAYDRIAGQRSSPVIRVKKLPKPYERLPIYLQPTTAFRRGCWALIMAL